MKTTNDRLKALSNGTTSTAPIDQVENLDKDDPLKNSDFTKEGIQRRRRRATRILLRRMVLLKDTRWFHHHQAISLEGTSKFHTFLTLDHHRHLMLLVLPIGKLTWNLTSTLLLLELWRVLKQGFRSK
jgi:hypothetical protein